MMILTQGGPSRQNSPEALAVRQYAMTHNIPIVTYESVHELSLEMLQSCRLMEGSVESIITGLKRLEKPVPEPNYYPDVLSDFLHRRVWPSTFIQAVLLSDSRPIFVKSQAWKALTGCVIDPLTIPRDVPDDMPVWISEVIPIEQEYRVYVQHNRIVYIARYDDHESDDKPIDIVKIQKAIQLMATHHPRVAYAFDWGLTDSGQTVLVENNDAWAIGRYLPMPYDIYTEFLISRWQEMRD
jgi:hypothetical protein